MHLHIFSTAVLTASTIVVYFLAILSRFLSYMFPRNIHRRAVFSRDLLIAMFNLVFGRLFSRLTVPHVDLTGKIAIVTGGNSGIGLQIASDLAQQGATIILACRSLSKAEAAIDTIVSRIPYSSSRVSAMKLDTSDLDSVKRFAWTWTNRPTGQKHIDIICHNAGISTPTSSGDFTKGGIEIVYATNLLGSFLLTNLLEPYLSSTARVIFTSSTGQYGGQVSRNLATGPVRGMMEPGFHCRVSHIPVLGWQRVEDDNAARYANSKHMQCAFVRLLQRKWDRELGQQRLEKSSSSMNGGIQSQRRIRGRIAHSFTPGFTSTPIFGKMSIKSAWKEPSFALLRATTAIATEVEQGAATGSWLASTEDESVVGHSRGGGYWDRQTRRMCNADVVETQLLDKMWARWEKDAGVQWR